MGTLQRRRYCSVVQNSVFKECVPRHPFQQGSDCFRSGGDTTLLSRSTSNKLKYNGRTDHGRLDLVSMERKGSGNTKAEAWGRGGGGAGGGC